MTSAMWMKIARPSMSSTSTSTLANPIFKLTRALNYCMRLECNHINQQRVLDTRFVRSLSCGTASWKPAGTKSDDTATKNQNRKDGRKEQGKGKKFFRSRTPWLETGRELLIWEGYKRNHKGPIPPVKTRIRCTRGPDKICGNPCPICRNRIKVHFRDVALLKQFICPHTGQILEPKRTGLCRQQQKRLEAAIEKAWDHGLIPFTVPRQMPEDLIITPPWNKIDIR